MDTVKNLTYQRNFLNFILIVGNISRSATYLTKSLLCTLALF